MDYCVDSRVSQFLFFWPGVMEMLNSCPVPLLASWALTDLELNEHHILLQLVQLCEQLLSHQQSSYVTVNVADVCHRYTNKLSNILRSSEGGCVFQIHFPGQVLQVSLTSKKGIFFFCLVVINILTSTILCGQRLGEEDASPTALPNPFAGIVAGCPVLPGGVLYWSICAERLPSCGLVPIRVCKRPCSHPTFLIRLQGCFSIFLVSADAQPATGTEAAARWNKPLPAKLHIFCCHDIKWDALAFCVHGCNKAELKASFRLMASKAKMSFCSLDFL